MKADKLKQIYAHANAIAELLYTETDSEQVMLFLFQLNTIIFIHYKMRQRQLSNIFQKFNRFDKKKHKV